LPPACPFSISLKSSQVLYVGFVDMLRLSTVFLAYLRVGTKVSKRLSALGFANVSLTLSLIFAIFYHHFICLFFFASAEV